MPFLVNFLIYHGIEGNFMYIEAIYTISPKIYVYINHVGIKRHGDL